MESFFLMWYEFLQKIFSSGSVELPPATMQMLNMIVTVGAILGVILTVAIVYKLIKYIFYAIFSMGRR